MDTKVTKKRLSEMMQYDWLKILGVIIVCIIVWEFLFTFGGVKLNPGQKFTVFYYPTINTSGALECSTFMNDVAFSYDVYEKDLETIHKDYFSDIMQARSSLHIGDIMIAENYDIESNEAQHKGDKRYNQNVMYWLTDIYNFYSFEDLAKDARDYVDSFKANGVFSDELIESYFRKRMKNDNRFRGEKNIQKGLVLEKERILFLDEQVSAFEWLIQTHSQSGLFAKYTKYQYASVYGDKNNLDEYLELYQNETEKSYGLNAEFLDLNRRENQKSISNMFALIGNTDEELLSKDVVVMVFDYKKSQPDLQYETIVFINSLVETYSDLFSTYQA